MATLESGFNPTYSENASILTGNPNRVTVDMGEEACKNALREYQGMVKPVKPLLSKNYRYKHNTLIYDRIKDDVVQIW